MEETKTIFGLDVGSGYHGTMSQLSEPITSNEGTSVRKMSEIENELEVLTRGVNSIQESVKLLNERLSPILRDAMPQENTNKAPARETLLGKSLSAQSEKLFSLSDWINDITNRLAI